MSIWTRWKSAYYWSRSTYHYYKKNYQISLTYLEKYWQNGNITKRHIAFKATLLLLQQKNVEARSFFEQAMNYKIQGYDSEYVDNYCRLYLHIAEHQSMDEALQRRLRSIEARSSTKRILPIPVL